VELQGIAKEGLRAVGVEAEDPPAFFDQALGVLADLAVEFREPPFRVLRPGIVVFLGGESECDKQSKPDQNGDC
jgi:hypothetical protein